MRVSKAHIAGVGISAPENSKANLHNVVVSAATKALLDAGATYGDVDQTYASFHGNHRIERKTFDTFGLEGTPVVEVDNSSALFVAAQSIRSRSTNCNLVVGIDHDSGNKSKYLVVALVLVSDLFLTSHAYLKDGAVSIQGASLVHRYYSRKSNGNDEQRKVKAALHAALLQASLEPKDIQILEDVGSGQAQAARKAVNDLSGKSQGQLKAKELFKGTTGFASLCGLGEWMGQIGYTRSVADPAIVWQLRGWAGDADTEIRNSLLLIANDSGTLGVLALGRSDGQAALKWSEVQNIRDGRERLGYNPAAEVRQITQEDIEAVRTKEHFVPTNVDVKKLGFGIKGGDRAALARL